MCLLVEESHIMNLRFLETFSSLVATGDIPGLFVGDIKTNVIGKMKANGVNGNDDEIYNQFIENIRNNLHIVFIMNSCNIEVKGKAISSPSILANVSIIWFDYWSDPSLLAIGKNLIVNLETEKYSKFSSELKDDEKRNRIVSCIIQMLKETKKLNLSLKNSEKSFNYANSRDFI